MIVCTYKTVKILSVFITNLIFFAILMGCTLDANLSNLLDLSSQSDSGIIFIETPNKLIMQNETGLVNLNLLANPDLYTEMYISNIAGCESGGNWEPYTTEKNSWQLDPSQINSTATVYVKFRGSGIGESSCTSDTIIWKVSKKFNMCGAVVSSADASGVLYDSGGESSNYSNNENCQFSITSSSSIDLYVDQLSIQNGDELKIYDGDINGILLQSFNGKFATLSTAKMSATSGTLTVLFVTNSSLSDSGFTLRWLDSNSFASSFKFNSGDFYTTSPTVNLDIGNNGSLNEMYVTNASDCLSGGVWETSSPNKSWTLDTADGDGLKDVYVKFRDSLKQETLCEKVSMVLYNTGPSIPIITYINPFGNSTTTPGILFIASSDNTSGLKNYEMRILRDSDGFVVQDWAVGQKSQVVNANTLFLDGLNLVEGEVYTAEIRAINNLGIASTAASTSLSWKVYTALTVSFGSNFDGVLGLGPQDPRSLKSVPSAVVGGRVFSQIDAGAYISCGIEDVTQKAYCWGNNFYGQLGNNSTTDSSTPVAVVGVDGGVAMSFSEIAVGYTHVCAIEAVTQKAYCWGNNANGQLGNSSTVMNKTPTAVLGVGAGLALSFIKIVAGYSHTCGIEAISEKAYCWGANGNGQLGDNTTVQNLTPVAVLGVGPGLSMPFSQISAGQYHTCAIHSTTKKAYCWGNNLNGRLGDNSTTQRLSPVLVLGIGGGAALDFAEVQAGYTHTCGIELSSKKAYCWGDNSRGQLGINSTTQSITPRAVLGPAAGASKNFISLSAGYWVTCGIEEITFKAYCWGSNLNGKLGNGLKVNSLTPAAVLGVEGGPSLDFSQVKNGYYHTCGIELLTKKTYCWGNNANGALGSNAVIKSLIPAAMAGADPGIPLNLSQISSSSTHSCGIETLTQKAYCWGLNDSGQLGNNSLVDSQIPVPVLGVAGGPALSFTQIVTGDYYTCGLEAGTQKAYCWGENIYGRLGNNTLIDSLTPVLVLGVGGGAPLSFTYIMAGNYHNCGIEALTKKAYCWGYNATGQLGDNTLTHRSTPVAVLGVGGGAALSFVKVTGNLVSTCGIEDVTQKVYCWGSNQNGGLGNNGGSDVKTPVAVVGVNGIGFLSFTEVSSGDFFTCGIEAVTKKAYCWGKNSNGQLGNSSNTESGTPVAVAGVSGGSAIEFSSITAGISHVCGIEAATEKAYCWGYNNNGQLGNDTTSDSNTPGPVLGTGSAVFGGLKFLNIEAGGNFTIGIVY